MCLGRYTKPHDSALRLSQRPSRGIAEHKKASAHADSASLEASLLGQGAKVPSIEILEDFWDFYSCNGLNPG